MLAATLVMASVGTLYAWSVFVVPIELAFGQSRAATSLVFSVATAAFTIGMLGGPRVLRERSPQAIALLSCLMAASGLALSAAAESVWLVVLGFGVLFGLANGLAYSSSLQIAQHAAPTRPGLFTGIAVASYMLGSVVGSPLLGAATEIWSFRLALLLLAAYLAAAGLLAFLLLYWSKVADVARADAPSTERRAPFGEMAVLWAVFLLSSLVGVMTLAHAAPLAASLPGGERHPASAAALVALGNGVGRLAGGWLSDRLNPRALLFGAPALIGAALAAVLAVPRLDVLLAALCIIGIGYGCIAGCLPAIVARSYGARSLPRLYGRLFTAWGLAGVVGPYLGGVLYDGQGDYELANAGAAVTAFAAALVGLAYKRTTTSRDQAREAK
ncbi:MAG: MFS transporter [Dongiaceae bacterium]